MDSRSPQNDFDNDLRLAQARAWLQAAGLEVDSGFRDIAGDASFRRYFRLRINGQSTVLMDAPPPAEDTRPFVDVTGRLRAAGLHAPQILEADVESGFLLLEDLGSVDYLGVLTPETADELYADAMGALLRLQTGTPVAGLPAYDEALLRREMQLFPDWLLRRHLSLEADTRQREALDVAFDRLVANALAQPVVCVHRDFHSRNLMRLGADNPGVIDFQDAVAGPVTYDLVSLLRDCYVRWPLARVEAWATGYLGAAQSAGHLLGIDEQRFLEWFDLMGVQRHLKAAGIFARLNHRDGKPGYLADIPRTLGYIVEVGERRPAMRALSVFIEHEVLPRL